MSDDEDVSYVKKPNTIHYGSLEETERLKQQQRTAASSSLDAIESDDDEFAEPEKKVPKLSGVSTLVPSAAINAAGNVNTSNEYFDLEQEV